MRIACPAFLALCLFALPVNLAAWAPSAWADVDLAPRLRRPVALVVSPDGRRLYAANQRSGSLSVVDLDKRRTAAEFDVGQRLADLTQVDDRRLLAVDEQRHELVLLRAEGAAVEVLARQGVSPYPVEAVADRDGRRAFVSSLWSRRLTEVRLPASDGEPLAVTRVVDLPFAPRKLLLTPDESRLIVADAFAGRLAVVDPAKGKLLAVREFPAHNIRGLAVVGGMLAVAHQMLNEYSHTVRNDVHWGMLMSNDLRWLPLKAALDPQTELYAGAHMHPVGVAGRGGADPADLAIAPDGAVAVSLGGADELALGREHDFSLRKISVGRRPTAVAFSPDGRFLYAANTFDDSISVVDVKREEVVDEISLGPQAELSLADRGELFFYDGRLSHDRWMSCHSCHTDGHTSGMLNDNLSDASFGAAKRVLSLLGVAETAPYAWSGQVEDLQTQIRNSISKTMQREEPPTEEEVTALAAFLQTLAPPPSLHALRGTIQPEAVARGKALFTAQKCDRCHTPPLYTSRGAYDVGLVDSQGNRRFNPPSLRGVGQRGPYFHDNRAATLEEVFQIHGHQLSRDLRDAELADLLAFLRSL